MTDNRWAVVRDGAAIKKPDHWVKLRSYRSYASALEHVHAHALHLDKSVYIVGVLASYGTPSSIFPKSYASEPRRP